MFSWWFADGRFDFHPIPHRLNFTEGHAGLHHSKWSGIHAEEDDPLAAVREISQIKLMGLPGVGQRVIDISHRCGETHVLHFRTEGFGRLNELFADRQINTYGKSVCPMR